ncbi:MAG: hypothetical protein JRH15_10835 [Deltaproteobacteria bacterium]|nr:hypothetical protein [Deltaproteobacteria bacterium]
MVERNRPADLLDRGRDKRLFLITGQAGSGKTSLACQWMDRHKLPVAWYSLDDYDNDPDLFFQYLMTSLQHLEPKLAPVFSPLLQDQKVFSPHDIVCTAAHHLGKLEKETFLVLDDYHLIKTREIHDAVSLLIQNAPPRLHIVLLTRLDPPFSLARLRSWNQVTEIRTSDLNFSRQEAQVFINEVLGIDLSNEQFEALYNWTEGWAAGLQLAGLSIQKRKEGSNLETDAFNSDWGISDYLITEVFNAQSAPVRSFFLNTAVLERFNADLCRKITGRDDAGEILEQLERNNLFLMPLDNRRHWFRYHHLFAESLRLRLVQKDAGSMPSLHRCAALWFAGNNLLQEAFHHAFASKDMEFAADLLEDHLMFLLANYELKSFRRWLNRLPHRLVRQRYLLMIHEGFEARKQGYAKKPEMILAELEKSKSESILSYSDKKKRYVEEQLLLLRHAISITMDPVNQDTDKLDQAHRNISSENTIARAELEALIAWVYINKGDITKALEPIQESFKNYYNAGIGFGMCHMNNLQARIAVGGFPEAVSFWYGADMLLPKRT